MCEYCDEHRDILIIDDDETGNIALNIWEHELVVEKVDSEGYWEQRRYSVDATQIRYCPMCGREL